VARGKGEGSIYRRGTDDRWVAQIEAGRSPSGRRRYARAVRRTRKEAHAALKELQRAVDANLAPGQASTVETFLAWWIDHVVKGTVTDTTVDRYRQVSAQWIDPSLGTVRLNKLTPAHVQTILRRLEERGLSAASRNLARSVLSRALRWAEQTNMIGRNPARLVQGPKAVRRTSDALPADEALAVLAEAKGDPLEALAVVALSRAAPRRGPRAPVGRPRRRRAHRRQVEDRRRRSHRAFRRRHRCGAARAPAAPGRRAARRRAALA
jgi:integrase